MAGLALAVLTACGTPEPSGRPAPDSPAAPVSRYEVFVLGIAQDGGLPHVGCTKPCCVTARATGRRETPASLGIHDRATGKLLLVEATPGIESQLALLHRLAEVGPRPQQAPVDGVLITHAHIGHYLGLAHFGREVASTDGLPVYGTERFASFLRQHGPWSQLCALDQIEPVVLPMGAEHEVLDGLFVEAVAVPHRDEFSDTVAFRIRGPQRRVLFVPDVDRWDAAPGLLDRLLDGVDVAWLDATFYDGREVPGRDLAEIPHPPMVDTMARLAEEARARPGRLRFIHLNHSNPALSDAGIRAEVEARGFAIASAGDREAL